MSDSAFRANDSRRIGEATGGDDIIYSIYFSGRNYRLPKARARIKYLFKLKIRAITSAYNNCIKEVYFETVSIKRFHYYYRK